jgi:hypothetical protein
VPLANPQGTNMLGHIPNLSNLKQLKFHRICSLAIIELNWELITETQQKMFESRFSSAHVIPDTQEARSKRIAVQTHLGKIMRPYLKN